jgi:acetyltransferase
VSREIVPVDGATARAMIESLRIWPLLKGTRGETGIDLDALVEIIERLSFFASQNPDITELDINPLMASAAGCRAVDARIIWG